MIFKGGSGSVVTEGGETNLAGGGGGGEGGGEGEEAGERGEGVKAQTGFALKNQSIFWRGIKRICLRKKTRIFD